MGLWDPDPCCSEPVTVVAPGLWATRLMACSGPSEHLECANGRSVGTPLQSNLCTSPGSLLPHGPFLHPLLGRAGHSLLQAPGPSFPAALESAFRPPGARITISSQLGLQGRGPERQQRGGATFPPTPPGHRWAGSRVGLVSGGPGLGWARSQVGWVSGDCIPKH